MCHFRFKIIKPIALGFFSLAVAFPARTPGQEASEYTVKAALLYNFAKFVQWPNATFKSEDEPIVFGILGKDPFGEAANLLNGKTIQNRKIELKRFTRSQNFSTCHILFISSSEKDHLESILNTLASRSVLTVGEIDKFMQVGGIINFIIVDDKIRFEINAAAAKHANIKISSQLLKLANTVKTD